VNKTNEGYFACWGGFQKEMTVTNVKRREEKRREEKRREEKRREEKRREEKRREEKETMTTFYT
jgi:acyl-CoA hydrolase